MPPQPPIDMGLFRAAKQAALTPAERARLTKTNFTRAPAEDLVATPDIPPEQLAEQIAEETHNGRDRFQDAKGHEPLKLDVEAFMGAHAHTGCFGCNEDDRGLVVVKGCPVHDKTPPAAADYSKVETIRTSGTVDSPSEWTAREALVDLLGQIDRGEVNVTDMLLFYRVKYDDGARDICWATVCEGDSMVLAGLASVAQHNIASLVAE